MKHRAFTLVEMLVVLLVLAILIAVLLPVFRRTKMSAGDIKTLSAVRQMHTAMALYTNEHDQKYPFLGVPGAPEAGMWINGVHRPLGRGGFLFFIQHQNLFVSVLVKHLSGPMEVADGPAYGVPTHPDRETPEDVYVSSILYSHSFIASPEFWKDGGPFEARHVQPTSVSMVRHPPRKGLLVYSNPTLFDEKRVIIGFADGSASKEQTNMSGSMNPEHVAPFMLNNRAPGMMTRDGVLGKDY